MATEGGERMLPYSVCVGAEPQSSDPSAASHSVISRGGSPRRITKGRGAVEQDALTMRHSLDG